MPESMTSNSSIKYASEDGKCKEQQEKRKEERRQGREENSDRKEI
jgi:hypothetical protein